LGNLEAKGGLAMKTINAANGPPQTAMPMPLQVDKVVLTGTSSNVYGLQVTLTHPAYVIGRAPHLDLRLPDATVAERHCQLTRQADGSYVVTSLSPNHATLVNGGPVREAVLNDGDVLRLGYCEFVCRIEAVPAPAAVVPREAVALEHLIPTEAGRRPRRSGVRAVTVVLLVLDSLAAAAASAALAWLL
jgi:hypothetical protein